MNQGPVNIKFRLFITTSRPWNNEGGISFPFPVSKWRRKERLVLILEKNKGLEPLELIPISFRIRS